MSPIKLAFHGADTDTDTDTDILTDFRTRILARMSVRDARVLYTISYRACLMSADRRIPNVGVGVRVGVGPAEFQLYTTAAPSQT